MPHVTFGELIEILCAHGFEFDRKKGSHCTYKGVVDGKVQIVTVAGHRGKDSIRPGTLSSIIRQSGLPKKLFK